MVCDGVPSVRVEAADDGIALFIIDPQNDFHPPNGSLGVPGALEDMERVIELITRLTDKITKVVVSLDSHHILHVANPGFWRKKDDQSMPDPFTLISAEQIASGEWTAAQPEMREWALTYAQELEKQGRFQICVWPEHCIIGTPGHNVHPGLMKALSEWSHKHHKTVEWLYKGMNNRTEMYSALKAEVILEDDPATGLNTGLIAHLAQNHKVVVCGQAKSHCVNYTARDLVDGWPVGRSKADIVLLADGSSAVPGFEEAACTFEEDMKAAGVTVVNAAEFNC